MKLLASYLWKNLLLSILMTWLSLSLLFALFDFLAELGDTKTGTRYGVLQALLYVAYSLPRTLYENFPYAALIGSLMGLGNLAANSEITAMRAAGFSIRQIVLTTLKLGLILSLLAFALGEWVVPRAEAYAENFKIRSLQQELSISEEGVWLKNGKQLIHIDKVWSETKVDGLAVYEVDEQVGGISRILKAEHAERQGESWQLQQVVDQYLSKNKVELAQHEQLLRYPCHGLPSYGPYHPSYPCLPCARASFPASGRWHRYGNFLRSRSNRSCRAGLHQSLHSICQPPCR